VVDELLFDGLLLEVPLLEVLPLARSAATQSSYAWPVNDTQRDVLDVEADGLVVELSDEEDDELGDEGLDALGELALPAEPAPVEPVPVLEAPGLALEPEPDELPALPACARTAPLASAPAARTASAFSLNCFIRILL
jgi:hypothetical protein